MSNSQQRYLETIVQAMQDSLENRMPETFKYYSLRFINIIGTHPLLMEYKPVIETYKSIVKQAKEMGLIK